MEGINTSGSKFVASKLYEVCIQQILGYKIINLHTSLFNGGIFDF